MLPPTKTARKFISYQVEPALQRRFLVWFLLYALGTIGRAIRYAIHYASRLVIGTLKRANNRKNYAVAFWAYLDRLD